ncbi:MAG: radical SAM protein [Pseudomonadota bacterium]|nr:radical SAM protein [Pseudomonadota bacterium]
MRVALIYPEVYDLARYRQKRKEYPPFGVLYLAAVLEAGGHHVAVLKVTPDEGPLDLREYDVNAWSIPSSATYGLIKRARLKSSRMLGARDVVGGVHPNFFGRETLLDLRPDLVGTGDCEGIICDMVELPLGEARLLPGVWALGDDGEPRVSDGKPLALDLASLPLAARHLLPAEDVVMTDRLAGTDLRMAHVMFSRGCPFPCRFCAAADTGIQYQSGARARAELRHLMGRYGISGFAIVDDNFVISRPKVIDVCRSIADLDLKWSALSRVDTVNEEVLGEMARAGCIEVKFGIESGSPAILKAMRKNTSPEQIRNAVTRAQAAGIGVKAFVVHGYPGENMETTAETVRLLRELSPCISRVTLFRFVPLPGTYVFNHPEEFNLHGTHRDPDWQGDWSKYHIYHNTEHWWGTDAEFLEVERSYAELQNFVASAWPDQLACDTRPAA